MKKILNLFVILIIISNLQAQNVGIGTPTPTLAKLEIKGAAGTGKTIAAFGTEGPGLSIQKDSLGPTIGFNHYRDAASGLAQGKYFANGYATIMQQEVANGKLKIDMYDIGVGGTNTLTGRRALTISNSGNVGIRSEADNNATLISSKLNNNNGSAIFSGSVYSSFFQYSALENTYIRGGLANSKVILNDVPGGKVGIGNQAGVVTNITSTLSVFGSLKLPGKVVTTDYLITEEDFTILADLQNNINNIIWLYLPPPSAATEGRIYVIKGMNMPTVPDYYQGYIKIWQLEDDYYTENTLANLYQDFGAGIHRRLLTEGVTVQCISNHWRVITRTAYNDFN
jgi:hypothetical protein